MPIARFQMPDGRIARFEVPVGTTPEQANSMFNSFLAQQGQQEEPRRDVGIIESGVAGLKKLLSSQRTALETPFGAEEAAQRGAARKPWVVLAGRRVAAAGRVSLNHPRGRGRQQPGHRRPQPEAAQPVRRDLVVQSL